MQSFKTIGVVGLGLIGGSLALALKRFTDCRVVGFDRDAETVRCALESGAVDAAGSVQTGEGLSACGLVLVALYPQDTVDFVRTHAKCFAHGALVVDLCGIKRFVCEALGDFCRARGFRHLGAHPMAGRETSGFGSADALLYQGASLVLTPRADMDAGLLDVFEALMRRCGFRELVHATPEHHDRMIGYTSQLAHVLSSAYIQNPLATDYSGFTGGSFQDLTRVARLNSAMWGELFLKNRDMLLEELDILLLNLEGYKQALQEQDARTLFERMDRGTAVKEALLSRTRTDKELQNI